MRKIHSLEMIWILFSNNSFLWFFFFPFAAGTHLQPPVKAAVPVWGKGAHPLWSQGVCQARWGAGGNGAGRLQAQWVWALHDVHRRPREGCEPLALLVQPPRPSPKCHEEDRWQYRCWGEGEWHVSKVFNLFCSLLSRWGCAHLICLTALNKSCKLFMNPNQLLPRQRLVSCHGLRLHGWSNVGLWCGAQVPRWRTEVQSEFCSLVLGWQQQQRPERVQAFEPRAAPLAPNLCFRGVFVGFGVFFHR